MHMYILHTYVRLEIMYVWRVEMNRPTVTYRLTGINFNWIFINPTTTPVLCHSHFLVGNGYLTHGKARYSGTDCCVLSRWWHLILFTGAKPAADFNISWTAVKSLFSFAVGIKLSWKTFYPYSNQNNTRRDCISYIIHNMILHGVTTVESTAIGAVTV